MIAIYNKRGETAIIEGMHLSSDFIEFTSKESNIISFAIDNKISMEKKINYKFNTTRSKLEYFDSNINETVYKKFKGDILMKSPYMNHVDRIQEIHTDIIRDFRSYNLPVIEFSTLDEGIDASNVLVNDFIRSSK
jgi:2-phosphoglycerate kinase